MALLAGLSMAVRHAARPVEALARAARRFSFDQAAPDLPVTGPRELRELSAAFNDMQGRIRDLVEARTRALAAIAHDLSTYLTRLRLRADFITDDHQRLRAICDIEEMSLLLDDTLTFAQPGAAGHLGGPSCDAEVEIVAFLDQARELGWPVRLIAAGAMSPARVACNGLSLRRMLHNLADNAVRYAGQAEIRLRKTRGALEIEIADRGPGVPPADLARIVQPFERLEASRGRETGGAGLGLAIVRSLAERAGGSLTLENAAEGGLRAILRLPEPPGAAPGIL
jgi:signal transduction histidine kinase